MVSTLCGWSLIVWTSPAAFFSHVLFNCCLNGDWSRRMGGLHSFEALLCELFYYISSLFFMVHLPVNDRKRFTRRNAYFEWNIDHFIWKAVLYAGVACSRFLSGRRFEWLFLLRCTSDVSRWRSRYRMFLAHLCVAVK